VLKFYPLLELRSQPLF